MQGNLVTSSEYATLLQCNDGRTVRQAEGSRRSAAAVAALAVARALTYTNHSSSLLARPSQHSVGTLQHASC